MTANPRLPRDVDAMSRAGLAVDRLRHEIGAKLYLCVGLLTAGGAVEGAAILLLVPLLGAAAGAGSLGTSPVLNGVAWRPNFAEVLAAFILLAVLQAALTRAKNLALSAVLVEFITSQRLKLFERLSRARWSYVSRLRGSDINQLLTADIDRVQGAVFSLLTLLQSTIMLSIYVAVSLLISPVVTAFAALVGAVGLLALAPARRAAGAQGDALAANYLAQNRTISEFVSGLKVAKSFSAESRYVGQLGATLNQARGNVMRYARADSLMASIVQILSASALAGFLYFAIQVLRLPMAELVVMIFVYMRIAPRIMALQTHIQTILTSTPQIEALWRANDECQAAAELEISTGRHGKLVRAIELRGVSYFYTAGAGHALKNASFEIPALSVTALIGPSGSGKSTAADMIAGLLAPGEGAVLIDGAELTEKTRKCWRQSVAYVPQDVFLLHDTIRANFLLAAPNASDEDVWRALEQAGARSFVEAMPLRLATIVGDRGLHMSGGERQRLALARALLRAPEILILDEATSALDWETQRLIAQALRRLRGKITILIIGHRPSMVEFADWVVALEDGRVVEAGDYDRIASKETSRLRRLIEGETATIQPVASIAL